MHTSKIWGVTVCTAFMLTVVAGCGSPSTTSTNGKPTARHLNQNPIARNAESYMGWATLIQLVMDNLKGSINVPLMAPTFIPSPSGYPSAQYQVGVMPSGVNNGVNYNVNLFATKTPVGINDPSLNHQLQFGSFGGSRFGSVAKALNGLDFLNHDEGIVPQSSYHVSSVNLGYHIYGKLFKQGGTTSIQWHEGRWLFEVNKNQGSADLNLAKQMVQFTQTNFLPIPGQKGLIIVNITQPERVQNTSTQLQSQVWWNKGAVLYHDQTTNPLNAMRMAVSTRLYSAKPVTTTKLGIEGTVQSVKFYANQTLLQVKVSAVPKVFSYNGYDYVQSGSVISNVFEGTPKNYFIGGGAAKKYLPVTLGQKMATAITSGKSKYGTIWHSFFDSYEYLQNGVYVNWKEQTFGTHP